MRRRLPGRRGQRGAGKRHAGRNNTLALGQWLCRALSIPSRYSSLLRVSASVAVQSPIWFAVAMAVSWECGLPAVCRAAQVDRGSTHSGSIALDGEYAATHTNAASKINPLISLFAPARFDATTPLSCPCFPFPIEDGNTYLLRSTRTIIQRKPTLIVYRQHAARMTPAPVLSFIPVTPAIFTEWLRPWTPSFPG